MNITRCNFQYKNLKNKNLRTNDLNSKPKSNSSISFDGNTFNFIYYELRATSRLSAVGTALAAYMYTQLHRITAEKGGQVPRRISDLLVMESKKIIPN